MEKRREIDRTKKIFLDDDLTATERQIQKHLWSVVKGERERRKKVTVSKSMNR